MPNNRRALPVRCGMVGANDASLFPANQKGARGLPFQRQTERRLRCLPSQKGRLFVTAATFSLPIVFVWYPHTRSTLRDNRFQRERWGNYTIFTLKAANKGLLVRVSDNQSLHGYCHSYHCKEKKAHSLYNYQVIYNLLLCYIIYILLFT